MRVIAAAAMLAASLSVVTAQEVKPFGITPGSQVTDYLSQDELSPEPDTEFSVFSRVVGENGKFDPDEFAIWVKPPDPHPEFKQYVVHQTPETGICLVRAIKTVEPGSNESEPGKSIRDFFKKIETQLASRYGQGRFSETFSLFSYDKDWIRDIGKKEKYYHTIWKPEATSDGLRIQDIFLYVSTVDSDASVNVEYTFTNYDKCRAIHKKTTPAIMESEASKF